MSRFSLSALGAAVLLGALAPLALAGQPDPGTSTWGNLVGVSPKNCCTDLPVANQYRFTGTLRDGAGAPVPNFPRTQVELDFGSCTNPSTRPADQIAADADSDINGQVQWKVGLLFGGADPCEVRVLVQNVVFKTLAMDQGLPSPQIDGGMRSVDENGDGQVSVADLSLFQQEFANTGTRRDWRGDLGPAFDGQTSVADLTTFQKHFAIACPSQSPCP